MFRPIVLMRQRLEAARSDSDAALFLDLLCYGEMVLKFLVATLVASIEDERQRFRYQQVYRLVRASGPGDWATVADDILTGPSAQHLAPESRELAREVTQNVGPGAWQYDAAELMIRCRTAVDGGGTDAMPPKMNLRRWLAEFTTLRNKTKGHGAPPTAVLARLAPDLEKSVSLVADSCQAFKLQWAYLFRNLSGKYRVTPLADSAVDFDAFKRTPPPSTPANGLFVMLGAPRRVELVDSDPDALDFFLANGSFTEKSYESLSYISGRKRLLPAGGYLIPPGDLPRSGTEGLGQLDALGDVFSNLPGAPTEYVSRTALESDLERLLRDDRHPVVSLVGRGGIGKTSLALTVLHKLALNSRFAAIIWFSARDIDLLPEGPRPVKPKVVTVRDMGEEYAKLVSDAGNAPRGQAAESLLAKALELGAAELGPTLFVFDNFETLRNPGETYRWLDTYVRSPNKIVITTRHHEFNGDYRLDVQGMNEAEAELLISTHAARLGVTELLTAEYRSALYTESDGHPYVIKVLLGEVAKTRTAGKVERLVANREEILTALFERTFNSIGPAAKRVFLTLCSWKSNVPQVILEAVLLRSQNERMDVGAAITELERLSHPLI